MPDLYELDTWFKQSEESQNIWKTQAQEDLNFYLGNQWDPADVEILKNQKRPHLTFNHILPRINLIMGYHIQNRQDIKVYHKSGSVEVADILTAIIKHIQDNSNGNYEISMAFLLGLISAKGYLSAYLDYDYDVNGELKIESVSPFQVFPDPYSEKYDLSDSSFLFRTNWLPKRKIELLYPDKKDDLSNINIDDRDRIVISTDNSPSYKPNMPSDGKGTSSDIDKYKYRVKQCWWREYESATFLFDVSNGVAKETELNNEQIKSILARFRNLRKIKRVTPKVHVTTYVGNTKLEDMIPFEDKGGLRRFPIVPFYSYWVDGNFFSFITQLKDPNREINKRYSQLLHHLNMSANSGWIADPDAVQDWDALEQMGSKPGVVIKKAKKDAHLERINPSILSEGHLVMSKEGAAQMNQISGVDPTLFGVMPETRESGIAMQVRQKQSITALESIFDNFRTTKQLLGKVLIELIQKSGAYSKEEILRIVIDDEEKEYKINTPTWQKKMFGIGQVINDVTVGEYDCTVSEAPSNPTARLAKFYAMLEAVKVGIPYPPESIIKASDFPDKEEALEAIKQANDAKAKMAQEEMGMRKAELDLKNKELMIKGQGVLLDAGIKEKQVDGKQNSNTP